MDSNTVPNNNSTQQSYAKVTKNTNHVFPNKNQAIIINVIDEIPLEEYIYEIGNIVGPENITHTSKLSNSRLCIFFNKKELVDKIVTEHNFISVNEHVTEIRRYINPAQRLIISNVCPSISHSIIEQALTENGIKLVSPISFLRAGLSREEYRHILSFRRQVYIAPEEEQHTCIPNSLVISDEDTSYRIFLSVDVTCFVCKQKGHMANKCPTKQITEQEVLTNQTVTNIIEENTTVVNDTENTASKTNERNNESPTETEKTDNQKAPVNNNTIEDTTQATRINPKRGAPSTSSIDDESVVDIPEETTQSQIDNDTETNKNTQSPQEKIKSKQKKPKTDKRSHSPDSQCNLQEILSPLKAEIEDNPNMYTLNYEELYKFIEQVQTTSDKLNTAREFTNDITGLLLTLKDLHNHLLDRATKNKFTRLIKRIREQLSEEAERTPKKQT